MTRQSSEAKEVRLEERFRARVRQQTAVAELAQRALAWGDLSALMDEAVILVARTLDVEYSAVLEVVPDNRALLLRAGTSWREGLVGSASVGTEHESQAGYTLLFGAPVVVEDLRAETRFRGEPLLRDHGVVSGVSVIIHGKERPIGVLSAHTIKRRRFGQEEVDFLQAVASVLTATAARKQVEEALRDMALFAELNPAPLVRLDKKGVVLSANPAAQALLGGGANDSVSAAPLLDATDLDIGRCIREGLIITKEVTLGQRHWQFTVRGIPELGVAHAYGSEITQRKRAEEELRLRDRELLTLHRISEIESRTHSLRVAFQAIIEEISSATEFPIVAIELCDEARQKMVFEAVKGIPLPFDAAALEVPVEETLSGIVARTGRPMVEMNAWERPEYANATLRRLSVRTFVCVPMIVSARVVGVLSLAHPEAIQVDHRLLQWAESIANYVASLTERKRAEEALRVSEERYRALFEGANDAIFVHQLNLDGTFGRFIAVNDVASARLGYSREELLGMTPADIIAPDAVADVSEILGRLRADGRITFETAHRARDGHLIPVEISTRLLDLEGQRTALSIARDITERKRAEQFREEYVSLISHDLRAPLTVIMGQAELLSRISSSADEPRRAQCVEAIRCSGKRLAAMIQDLVDSVRLESGQMELKRESLVLQDLLREIAAHAIPPIYQGRVRLHLPDDPWRVIADREHLQRVVVNLITNALKYSDSQQVVDVRLVQQDDQAQLSVVDRGEGVEPRDLPHIFERFYRTRAAKKAEGLGLGLYICRQIVEAHGGRIWVDSEVGKGSAFHVGLPLA